MKLRGIFEKVPGSGVWWIRYADAAGRIRREKAGTKAGAIALYHKRKAEALQGKKLPEKLRQRPVLFREIAEDALAYSKQNKRSYQTDICRFPRLKEWFGDHPADDLAPTEIEDMLDQVAREERWAPATFNHYRSLISLAYRLAIRNRKATANPARPVQCHRRDNNRIRFLTVEEEERLRKVIAAQFPWHTPELDLAIHTGLRLGNQYGLTWDMVDWGARMLRIPRTKNEEPLNAPLNDVALAALRVVRARGNGAGRVFLSQKTGEPLEHPRFWFERAIREAKITDFHWHDLRHTFASRLRMQGVALEDIADLLGHKSLTMTRRYAHLGPSRLHEAVSRIATDTRTSTGQVDAERVAAQYYVN